MINCLTPKQRDALLQMAIRHGAPEEFRMELLLYLRRITAEPSDVGLDARRYRWLRKTLGFCEYQGQRRDLIGEARHASGFALDGAIDEAIATEETNPSVGAISSSG